MDKTVKKERAKRVKPRWFAVVFTLLLFTGTYTAAWAQEEKSGIFSVIPAVTFSWYPYTHFYEEVSTDTFVDLDNYGMSVMMGLKLFDKVGAHLNLKIDDPSFTKLVDLAGYVTAYRFMLKFDYHAFGGTVRWTGTTPNPIPGGYDFRNQWNNVSLLFRLDQLNIKNEWLRYTLHYFHLVGPGNFAAVGIGYANYEMPLEYRLLSDSGLANPGFGLVKGNAWGISVLWDTLTYYMEYPIYRSENWFRFITDHLWIYVDWFTGLPIGNAETDDTAIAWMSNANGGVSVNGNIDNRSKHYSVFKASLGFQYKWNIGKKGRIGLGVGIELLEELIGAGNNDIKIDYWSRHIGPAVRVSAYW